MHSHATRAAGSSLFVSTRNHGSVGYRIPKEWASVPAELRGVPSLAAFKRRSRVAFLSEYARFACIGVGCRVCAWQDSQRGQD